MHVIMSLTFITQTEVNRTEIRKSAAALTPSPQRNSTPSFAKNGSPSVSYDI